MTDKRATLEAPTKEKGLYARGGVWWYQPSMSGGFRPKPISLQTADYPTAVQKKRDLVLVPVLDSSQTIHREIEVHLADMRKRLEGGYARSTADMKLGVLKNFANSLPRGTRLADVQLKHVQNFYDETAVRCALPTAHKQWMDVRALFTWALAKKKVRTNPALGLVEKPGGARKPKRVLFCPEALMDQLIDNCPDEDIKLFLMLGFHAGFRRNEIIHAVPSWFDLENGIINLHDTSWKEFNETKRARSLPMRAELRTFLINYGLREPFMLRPEVSPGKGLYRVYMGTVYYQYMASQQWQGKNCLWVTPHVLRHTFASLLAQDGVEMWQIAAFMGIDRITAETTYIHADRKNAMKIELKSRRAALAAVA